MSRSTARSDEDRIVDDRGRHFIAIRHRFPANVMGFLLAPVTWFVYFIAAYSIQGAACSGTPPGAAEPDGLTLALALVTLAACGTIVASGVWSFRAWKRLLRELENEERQPHGRSAFLAYGALLHAGLFLVATLWIGIPILLLGACA